MKTKFVFRARDRLLGVACLLACVVRSVVAADVVLDWNIAMTHHCEIQPPPGAHPPEELRAFAMAHIAMFNAISRAVKTRGSADAAGAQAAHDVLLKVLPAGTAAFDALLAHQLKAIPEGAEKSAGIKAGAAAATELIAARASDGILASEGPYKPGQQPGDYQFTPPFDGPPFNGYATFPKLGAATPFVLKRGDQFHAPPPYKVTDADYARDLNEVKALGARQSTARTPDQTEIAQFWFEMPGYAWNHLARALAEKQEDSLLDHARLFAALNAALNDAAIAVFESKYTYNFWRPITAIRQAATDGNDLTAADPRWEPMMPTAPMPDYPSAHASGGAAAAVVLIWFFHGDEHTFTLNSPMTPQFPGLHPRTFQRLSDAAQENALSRLYVGYHFRRACLAGLDQGRLVGAWVVQHSPYTEGR